MSMWGAISNRFVQSYCNSAANPKFIDSNSPVERTGRVHSAFGYIHVPSDRYLVPGQVAVL
eukprot:6744628-Prymnesium_polylepis.1